LKINVYFIFLNIGDLTFGIALVDGKLMASEELVSMELFSCKYVTGIILLF
jgi:hypothetical protein